MHQEVFLSAAGNTLLSEGCRIVTALSDVGGDIAFDTLAPPPNGATGEGWDGKEESAIHQMNEDGQDVEKKGEGICTILEDGVLRSVDVPSGKVSSESLSRNNM